MVSPNNVFKILIIVLLLNYTESSQQPNILFILADDLGYNDVGYHGNNQVKTPNIDALAYNGVILEKFYTLPTCTPSRAAMLTGNYPIRYGFQGLPIQTGEKRSLPSNITILPQYLKRIGYKTHLVGKWHLGFSTRNVTPIARGFDSHYGYYNGLIGYFDHQVGSEGCIGLDFRDNFQIARNDTGKYTTDLLTARTVKIIQQHDYKNPLFVMLSHLAVHTGKSTGELTAEVEERDTNSMNKNFGYIKDTNRRKYVDALKSMDDSVGIVIKALAQKKVLDNTIILFLSDNGAPTYGDIHPNYGSNWPLKGIKVALFEGGVRVPGIFYSKNMTSKGKINTNLMHLTDLLPTFYAAGGGNVKNLGKIDGTNQYESLMHDAPTRRKEVLVNIEEVKGSAAIITSEGRYKLIDGIQYNGSFDAYGGVSGRDPEDGRYDYEGVVKSDVNRVLGNALKIEDVKSLRRASTTKNCRVKSNYGKTCAVCLFDLERDPCEAVNLAEKNPDFVKMLRERLSFYRKQLVPQQSVEFDKNANPKYFGGVWTFWLDPNPLK